MKSLVASIYSFGMVLFANISLHDTLQIIALASGAVAGVAGAINGTIELFRRLREDEQNEDK